VFSITEYTEQTNIIIPSK